MPEELLSTFEPIHLVHLVIEGEAAGKKNDVEVVFPGIHSLELSDFRGRRVNGLASLFNAIADAGPRAASVARQCASLVKPVIVQGAKHRGWHARAMAAASLVRGPRPLLAAEHLGRVRTVVYMKQGQTGDLVNFEQAVWDLLQDAGLISNDFWINSHDGSERRWTEPDVPRIEVDLWDIGPRVIAQKPQVRVLGLDAALQVLGPIRFSVEMPATGQILRNLQVPRDTARDKLVREASRIWRLHFHTLLPDQAVIRCVGPQPTIPGLIT